MTVSGTNAGLEPEELTVGLQPKHLWIFPDMSFFLLYPESLSGERKFFALLSGSAKRRRNNANGVARFPEVTNKTPLHMTDYAALKL